MKIKFEIERGDDLVAESSWITWDDRLPSVGITAVLCYFLGSRQIKLKAGDVIRIVEVSPS